MVKLHVHESAFAILKLKHAVKKSRCMQMLDGTQGTSTASIDIDVSQPARLHHLPLSPSPYLPALRMIGALDIVPPPVIVSSQRPEPRRPSRQATHMQTFEQPNLSNLSCGGTRRQTTALAKVPAQIFSD